MTSLLIGAVIDSAFSVLHERLRVNTLELARRKFGRVIPTYSPWLCFAPLVTDLDSRLIYYVPPTRGGLVTNSNALDGMATFLANEGRIALEDLPGEYTRWLPSASNISDVFDDAISVIKTSHPVMKNLYEEVVDYVVPLGGGRNRGYSSHLTRGAIFRALPADGDRYDVALDIMHEVGHNVLMVWQSVNPIMTSDPNAPVFSQIRRTNRPAIQSFHATVALAYMRFLEQAMSDDPGMHAAATRRGASYTNTLSHSLMLALESVRKECTLTEVGAKMADEMEALI